MQNRQSSQIRFSEADFADDTARNANTTPNSSVPTTVAEQQRPTVPADARTRPQSDLSLVSGGTTLPRKSSLSALSKAERHRLKEATKFARRVEKEKGVRVDVHVVESSFLDDEEAAQSGAVEDPLGYYEMGAQCCGAPHSEHKEKVRFEHGGGETKQLRRHASQAGLLGGLALKFPHVRRAFKNVKAVYDAQTVGKDGLTGDKLGPALQALGAHNLSNAEIQKLFQVSDLDHSTAISFREFLIAVALGYYLRKDLDEAAEIRAKGPKFAETLKGFKIIKEAFDKIDKDHGGTVDPKELKDALFEVGSGSQASKEILEARFKELDFDGSKEIEFHEFVYGFAAWVGMSEDDDDDVEDEALLSNTQLNNKHEGSN